jgi:MoaD family protein
MAGTSEHAADSGLVTIRVFGALREFAGSSPLHVDAHQAPTVDGLLAWLDGSHPKLAAALQGGLRDGYLSILINGRNVRFLDGRSTSLAAGDTVAFLPPIGGG